MRCEKENKMKKYKYLIFGLSLVLVSGCKSAPKRELDTREGVIAANFNLHREEVEKLSEKELTEDELIKLLIISKTTYLTPEEVYSRFLQGEELMAIGEEAGLTNKMLEEKYKLVKENIKDY